MSIWAGIKYALNSTLGTADFKPLDVLLTEVKGLRASDNVYKYIFDTDTIVVPSDKVSAMLDVSFTAKVSGSIRIKITGSDDVGNYNGELRIGKNQILEVATTPYTKISLKPASGIQEGYADIAITAGDVITFRWVKASSYSAVSALSKLLICADPINISGIEINR